MRGGSQMAVVTLHSPGNVTFNSAHQWVEESTSPPLKSRLALWLALTNKIKLQWLCKSSQPWSQGAMQLLLLASLLGLCATRWKSPGLSPWRWETRERDWGPDKSQSHDTSHVGETITDQPASDKPLVTIVIWKRHPERETSRKIILSEPSRNCWCSESWAHKMVAVLSY